MGNVAKLFAKSRSQSLAQSQTSSLRLDWMHFNASIDRMSACCASEQPIISVGQGSWLSGEVFVADTRQNGRADDWLWCTKEDALCALTIDHAFAYARQLTIHATDDWKLPDIDVLGVLYSRRNSIAGLSDAIYASSTPSLSSPTQFMAIDFSDGSVRLIDRYTPVRVRCVRVGRKPNPNKRKLPTRSHP